MKGTRLCKAIPGEIISIQSEHVRNGEKLQLPVYSYFSQTDSVITVTDYRPVVRSLSDVKKPSGYLIPKQLKELTDWVERQRLNSEVPVISKNDRIEQYEISKIDSIDFEGDRVIDPGLSLKEAESGNFPGGLYLCSYLTVKRKHGGHCP